MKLLPPPGLKINNEKKFENDMIRTAFICAEFVLRDENDLMSYQKNSNGNNNNINNKIYKNKREINRRKYVFRKLNKNK